MTDTHALSQSSACVAGLEVTIFGAAEHAGAPVVFLTHGRGGTAAGMFDWCREVAALDLIAVAVEQRNHGNRLVDARANGDWSPSHAADMYGSMLGTALDISLLIDMLPARLSINTNRVGMTGISMGGHATLLAMALDMRITVGAPLIGSGDYRRLMELRATAYGCPPAQFAAYFPAALQAAVAKYDPIHHVTRFADRPLLLANGADDTLVQLACNEHFAAAARPYYTDAERLRLSAYPGVGHEVPPAMWAEAKCWLQRWLMEEDDSGL